MRIRWIATVVWLLLVAGVNCCRADVKAWEGTITVPTYPWREDVNPKFWALEVGPRYSTTVKGSIVYPYTMQDHLLRTKQDRTYKALFLENEYLKITCLPELGGRLHSVFDKTTGEEMFHLNPVIKPSTLAMRGAWISGGVEWNFGPHGHTVNVLSPVDALIGRNRDGSAFLEISNREKIFRTHWTVRVTLHPGKAYLDERIRIENPTDAMHPYYFWNCTAFPCRGGTRFIYPMSLGTDHDGREFFNWPIHQGKDLTWLKNYEKPSSVFAVQCEHDFFGAYDVDADRGIVQVANHHELIGKKAWTWGQSDDGRVSQENLTDDYEAYIEVQSGPLPTQNDYGMLAPRQRVAWREWWLPVHGLGDGFEFANKNLVVHTSRQDGKLQLRLLATGKFAGVKCSVTREGQQVAQQQFDLSPGTVETLVVPSVDDSAVEVTVTTSDGRPLASFTTPLPIRKVDPPDPSSFIEKPDEQLSAEENYLRGRKHDRATDRPLARRYYEAALAADPGHVAALRALAVLDIEAGEYQKAAEQLLRAIGRDADDGLAWYFLGVCRLRSEDFAGALRASAKTSRCLGTESLGYDLAGRAHSNAGEPTKAVEAFAKAVRRAPDDTRAKDHLMLALYAVGDRKAAERWARHRIAQNPTALAPRAVLALKSSEAMTRFATEVRKFVGEDDFQMQETALVFAELGLAKQAAELLTAVCVEPVDPPQRDPLSLYYAAYYFGLAGDRQRAETFLGQASECSSDFVFASRPEVIPALQFALQVNSDDGYAHFHLGNVLANLGRIEDAVAHWRSAARLNLPQSVLFRNLGLAHRTRFDDPAKAEQYYRKAIELRGDDQTLYRDLADVLIAAGRRSEGIELLEAMPSEGIRRADVILLLAEAYLDEGQYAKTLEVLRSTPYFVNWEGQTITWDLFHRAHVGRGRERLEAGDPQAALEDFEAALTYPDNLGVGRSHEPEEAYAQYYQGRALQSLGRDDEARAAYQAGAAGPEDSENKLHGEYRAKCVEALESLPRDVS